MRYAPGDLHMAWNIVWRPDGKLMNVQALGNRWAWGSIREGLSRVQAGSGFPFM
jgi:hypothetical protein